MHEAHRTKRTYGWGHLEPEYATFDPRINRMLIRLLAQITASRLQLASVLILINMARDIHHQTPTLITPPTEQLN
jgi:hypothetical protein